MATAPESLFRINDLVRTRRAGPNGLVRGAVSAVNMTFEGAVITAGGRDFPASALELVCSAERRVLKPV